MNLTEQVRISKIKLNKIIMMIDEPVAPEAVEEEVKEVEETPA